MSKKKGKMPDTDRLEAAAQAYREAREALDRFVQENPELVNTYETLDVAVKEANEAIKTEARNLAIQGRRKFIPGVTVQQRTSRVFDAEKLLALKPELAAIPGLFTVSAASFDKAKASQLVDEEIEAEVVSSKPSYIVKLKL